MIELYSTRANPMIDPAIHLWGWEIPIYLFLGGLVAGMMVISGFFLLSPRYRSSRCACFLLPALGLVLLSAGMFALFLDLEHKPFFWRLYTTFEPTSPMSWGSWILLLVYPALAANLLLGAAHLDERWPRLKAYSERLLERRALVRGVGIANMVLGGALGIYTGILLSTLGARPLWSSAVLGPLFLASGLSSAAAFVHLVAREREERELLAKADNGFLVAELFLIALYVIGLATTAGASRAALGLLMGGPFTAVFWVFVVGLGIAVPLVIQPLATLHKIPHTPLAPILVIAGGLILRFVIVYAGQASHWSPV
ncbi:MAG: polysulfide reductase NrfD [Thermoanaerobaculia bacterium]|nr:polysulfide reductase NrfD [Thermoanaerobaculia bacterium]